MHNRTEPVTRLFPAGKDVQIFVRDAPRRTRTANTTQIDAGIASAESDGRCCQRPFALAAYWTRTRECAACALTFRRSGLWRNRRLQQNRCFGSWCWLRLGRFNSSQSRFFCVPFGFLFCRIALDLQTDEFRPDSDLLADFTIDGDDLAAA